MPERAAPKNLSHSLTSFIQTLATMFIYIQSEPHLWTVGHYEPGTGKFIPESDHEFPALAANRAIELNGGTPAKFEKMAELLMRADNFTKSIVNAILEYRQSKQPIDISLEDWSADCFEIYYQSVYGGWHYSRIAEALTQMINDPEYNVSETEISA